jgi:hypothetical protein
MVQIHVYADFDGVLLEPEGDIDRELGAILEKIELSHPKELEKDVFEEFSLLLCKSCRDRFVDEAKHPWEGPLQIRRDPDRIIH